MGEGRGLEGGGGGPSAQAPRGPGGEGPAALRHTLQLLPPLHCVRAALRAGSEGLEQSLRLGQLGVDGGPPSPELLRSCCAV